SAAGLASGTGQTTLNLQPGTSPVTWGTSDTSLFGLQDDGSGFYGPTFLKNGIFLAFAWASLGFAGAPNAGTTGRIGLTGNNFTVAGDDTPPVNQNLAGTAYQVEPTRVAVFNLPSASITPPYYSHVTVGQHSGNTSNRFSVNLLIVQLDGVGNTNF